MDTFLAAPDPELVAQFQADKAQPGKLDPEKFHLYYDRAEEELFNMLSHSST